MDDKELDNKLMEIYKKGYKGALRDIKQILREDSKKRNALEHSVIINWCDEREGEL